MGMWEGGVRGAAQLQPQGILDLLPGSAQHITSPRQRSATRLILKHS